MSYIIQNVYFQKYLQFKIIIQFLFLLTYVYILWIIKYLININILIFYNYKIYKYFFNKILFIINKKINLILTFIKLKNTFINSYVYNYFKLTSNNLNIFILKSIYKYNIIYYVNKYSIFQVNFLQFSYVFRIYIYICQKYIWKYVNYFLYFNIISLYYWYNTFFFKLYIL